MQEKMLVIWFKGNQTFGIVDAERMVELREIAILEGKIYLKIESFIVRRLVVSPLEESIILLGVYSTQNSNRSFLTKLNYNTSAITYTKHSKDFLSKINYKS